MADVETTELKRRVRAVWSYSLLEQNELAEQMGVKPATLRGWLRKQGPRIPVEVALKMADVCGVPRAFVLDGWDTLRPAPATDPAIEQRLAAIEEKLSRV